VELKKFVGPKFSVVWSSGSRPLLVLVFVSTFLDAASVFAQSCACPSGYTPSPSGQKCERRIEGKPLKVPSTNELIQEDVYIDLFDGGGVNFLADADGKKNWPMSGKFTERPTTATVVDALGNALSGLSVPIASNWNVFMNRIDIVNSAPSGSREFTWYSKAFCVNLPKEEHHVFYMGGGDNASNDYAWKLKIDGEHFVGCEDANCYLGNILLGKTLGSGRHSIEIHQRVGKQGKLWFADFLNSNAEVEEALRNDSPTLLNVKRSSGDLVGSPWDYDDSESNLCPPGMSYDVCSSPPLCYRNEVTPCGAVALEVTPVASCAQEPRVLVKNTFLNPLKGRFKLNEKGSGAEIFSNSVLIPGIGAVYSRSLVEIFSGKDFKIVPALEYALSFIPDAGSVDFETNSRLSVPTPFSVIDEGCGEIQPIVLKCEEPIRVRLRDLSTSVTYRLGIQESEGTVTWGSMQQGPLRFEEIDKQFPNQDFRAGRNYELLYESRSSNGVQSNPKKVSFTLTPECPRYGEIQLSYPEAIRVFVPTAFSPDGDGLNERLETFGDFGIRWDFFRVYNSLGELIYEASGPVGSFSWDGTYKNQRVPNGTYALKGRWRNSTRSSVDFHGRSVQVVGSP
jgi:hypothetical protein